VSGPARFAQSKAEAAPGGRTSLRTGGRLASYAALAAMSSSRRFGHQALDIVEVGLAPGLEKGREIAPRPVADSGFGVGSDVGRDSINVPCRGSRASLLSRDGRKRRLKHHRETV